VDTDEAQQLNNQNKSILFEPLNNPFILNNVWKLNEILQNILSRLHGKKFLVQSFRFHGRVMNTDVFFL